MSGSACHLGQPLGANTTSATTPITAISEKLMSNMGNPHRGMTTQVSWENSAATQLTYLNRRSTFLLVLGIDIDRRADNLIGLLLHFSIGFHTVFEAFDRATQITADIA